MDKNFNLENAMTIVSMVLTVTILPVAYWLIFSRADRKSINH